VAKVDTPPYDEVFALDGVRRPPYAELQRRLGRDPLRPGAAAWRRLRDHPLRDDARLLPVPWVLDAGEYEAVVQAGIAQRARALQLFFADLVLGPQRFLAERFLTRTRLETILRSEGTSLARLRALWRGHAREEIRFVYGPDLMRGPDGQWLLLEDNVGCVGGAADGHFAWSLYLAATEAHGVRAPSSVEPDLQVALRTWLGRLGMGAGDPGVVALQECEADGDALHSVLIRENERRRLILEQAGVSVVEPHRPLRLGGRRPRAILNFHSLSELIEEAFHDGTALFNAPGTGILGNKELLPHVGEMIRFFQGEEPIIGTPLTNVCLNGALPPPTGDWVVKSAIGRGGTDVFVLRREPRERLDAIRNLVRMSWPKQTFVAQQRIEPSRLPTSGPASWDSHSVELRPVAYLVGWSEVHVSRRPVGKAIWGFDANARHNVSRGACYIPTTVLSPREQAD
jgi:hypothetical protein